MPLTPQEQKQLAEVLEEIEPFQLTPEDLNRLAAIHEEEFSEGRRHRPFPTNPRD